MNIYVGNLSPQTSEWQVRKAFDRYGKVGKISIDKQPHDGTAYNFCFVEMPFNNQASIAIRELNGKDLCGNIITTTESGLSA